MPNHVKYVLEVTTYLIVQSVVFIVCLAVAKTFSSLNGLSDYIYDASGLSSGGIGTVIVQKIALFLAIAVFLGNLFLLFVAVGWHFYLKDKHRSQMEHEARKRTNSNNSQIKR